MDSGYQTYPEFVRLPHFQPTWMQSKELLQRLVDRQVKDWNEFNEWMKAATVPCWGTKGSETSVVPTYFKNQKFTLLSVCSTQEAEFYFSLLPWIAEMALTVETAFPEQIPFLNCSTEREIHLSKHQSCSLLAAFFLCQTTLQHSLIHVIDIQDQMYEPCQELKFLSLVAYFWKVRRMLQRKTDYFACAPGISFYRNVDNDRSMQFWEELNAPLTDMKIDRENGILEYPEPALRIDFANMYIGGGVLDYGNVQEELYFAIHPELYLSMLCCAVMQDNEAIVVVGAERVATYSGYGYVATLDKVVIEYRKTDERGRLEHYMVAMDARPYNYDKTQQFQKTEILRELNKAYVGFRGDPYEHKRTNLLELKPIVTGNWGCGMFCGDPQLKSLIQWIAATAAGRKIAYCVHRDRRLTKEFEEVVEKYRRQPANILLADIFRVAKARKPKLKSKTKLFKGLLYSYFSYRTAPDIDEALPSSTSGIE